MGLGQSTNPIETPQGKDSSDSSGIQEHDGNAKSVPPKLPLAAKQDNRFLFTSHCLINQANLCTILRYNLESDAWNSGKAYESTCALYCHKCIKRIRGTKKYLCLETISVVCLV